MDDQIFVDQHKEDKVLPSPEPTRTKESSLSNPSLSNEKYENTLEQFATYLGTKSLINGIGVDSYQLSNFLAQENPSNPADGGFCVFPSFDLGAGDVTDNMPLSKLASLAGPNNSVQRSSNTTLTENGGSQEQKSNMQNGMNIPPMAASIPGLNLQHPNQLKGDKETTSKNGENAEGNADTSKNDLEKVATAKLGSKMSWTRSSAHLAPNTILRSLSKSFSNLVDSQFAVNTLGLLKNLLSNGKQSQEQVLQILAPSSPIKVKAVETLFQTLKLPPNLLKKTAQQQEAKENEIEGETNSRIHEVTCPLLFEAKLTVTIKGQEENVMLRTAGTLKGKFTRNSITIKYAEVDLDMANLVKSILEQARNLVLKAVTLMSKPSTASHILQKSGSNSIPTSRLKKSPSLLRTVENMQQRVKKSRSVTFDHEINSMPFKRQKCVKSESTLKSSKSFGKPDASLFHSQKNATFADFGTLLRNDTAPQYFNSKKVSMVNSRSMGSLLNSQTYNEEFSVKHLNRNAAFSQASMSLTRSMENKSTLRDFLVLQRNRKNNDLRANLSLKNLNLGSGKKYFGLSAHAIPEILKKEDVSVPSTETE